MSPVTNANSLRHRPSPANSPIIHSRLDPKTQKSFKKIRKKKSSKQKKKIVSLQVNISTTPFDQKFTGNPEVGVLNCHRTTDRQTDGHCNSMTESVQCSGPIQWKEKHHSNDLMCLIVTSIMCLSFSVHFTAHLLPNFCSLEHFVAGPWGNICTLTNYQFKQSRALRPCSWDDSWNTREWRAPTIFQCSE